MTVEVFAGRSDGWRSLADGHRVGSDPDQPPDLAGYTLLTAPGANARNTIQNALDAHGKVALVDVASGGAANWDCSSSLLLDSSMELYVGAGVNLWRNFNSSNATSSGFIKNRSFASAVADCKIWGAGNIAARTGMGGNILSLWADRLWSSGWKTTYYKRHTMIAGNDIVMQGHVWRVDPTITSGGAGLRYAGGNNFLGQDLNIISGDDVFQFVPAGATSDPLWNIDDCTNGMYLNCVGKSKSARVCVVGLQDSNGNGSTTLGMNVSCSNLMFRNVQGYGGGTAVNVANHSSTGTITDIKFDKVLIDQSQTLDATHGQPGETFAQVEGTSCGNVNGVDFAGTRYAADYTTGTPGVYIYNKRAAKDLTHINDVTPQHVFNVTTANTHAGDLGLVL